MVLNLYTWVVIIARDPVVADRLRGRQHSQRLRAAVWNLFLALTEPFLRPIRNFLPNTGGIDMSPIVLLLGDHAPRADHHLLHLPVRVLKRHDPRSRIQDRRRPVLRGLPHRRRHPARHPAHDPRRRRLALFGALRHALRAAERGHLRPGDRLSAKPDRRPARLPCRVRQDGSGRLAQRRRQPRLRRLPVPRGGLSGRHAVLDVRGDRPQGKLEPAERRRLCAFAGRQPARRDGDRLCALGDGAQARPPRAGA